MELKDGFADLWTGIVDDKDDDKDWKRVIMLESS